MSLNFFMFLAVNFVACRTEFKYNLHTIPPKEAVILVVTCSILIATSVVFSVIFLMKAYGKYDRIHNVQIVSKFVFYAFASGIAFCIIIPFFIRSAYCN